MKIQFDPNLDFQADAISAVADLFDGQETCQTNFTVSEAEANQTVDWLSTDMGIGNRLKLLDEDLLSNLNRIQYRNGLKPSTTLGDLNITVEMETGTGKTYVYLRSMFELNRRYGFTKFIVVVPSIAIKEGVYKSLQITEDHFRGLYDNTRFDYFIYDSQKLGQVRNFATSDCIQIMIINIDAFRRSFTNPEAESKSNIIHRAHDRMMGAKPIDFIRDTQPIVIIDEPQSVDTTAKSADAIASLNPLCTIRYSATHKEKHHPVYRLDSVDAYERKLVKQIEVAGITVADSHNQAYVRLVSVDNRHGISARIELDTMRKGKIKREIKKVKVGADLCELSGGREVYNGYILEDIFCAEDNEHITFTSSTERVKLSQSIGEVNQDEYKRLQIRKTIEEHLRKEKRLRPMGLKVLSLFFIDRVANYRAYDDQGNPQKGKYAQMFDEEYRRAIGRAEFNELFEGVELETAADGVHDGYFSVDKKKDAAGASKLKDTSGKTAADEGAYQLIMRDKERLLSFESKLKFIFSHSALREGWDNPNVFQICTLNETSSVMKKRQEIGRGLRIAVNQAGERVREDGVNTLTVMANESYEEFAKQLQKEIEDDTGIRFGRVEKHLFAAITVNGEDGSLRPLGMKGSTALWNHLKQQNYVDAQGKVTDQLKAALKANVVNLPEELAAQATQVKALLTKVAGSLNIRNADERTPVRLNKERYLSNDFKTLWDRIKYQTTFRVDFDVEALINTCADDIKDNVNVPKARFVYSVAATGITRSGVSAEQHRSQVEYFEAEDQRPPDILSFLQNETNLTRRTLVEILRRADNLFQFKRNPNRYIEQVTQIIKARMQTFIVDGIQYQRLGNNAFYGQELFKDQELFGYLEKNMVPAKDKSIYEYVVYDSEVERDFAKGLNASEEVKVFAKLPSWFQIDTPLGSYNPDWAVLVKTESHNDERLFFVVETKGEMGALFTGALRASEEAKIKCGEAHFQALDTDVVFETTSSFETFRGQLGAL